MKTKLDSLIDEIQAGKPGQDTVAAEIRSPFRDEFEQPENGWMVEREMKPEPAADNPEPNSTKGNEYMAGDSHFHDTGDEITVHNCFVASVGITWELHLRVDDIFDKKYDQFIAKIPLGNRAYTDKDCFLVDSFQVIMERRQFGADYQSLVEKARDDYLKNNGPGAGLVDTTGPISSEDNYQTNNIKIDPREIYKNIGKSMKDILDVVDCGEGDE